MDRLVRARALLAEAEALGVTIDDLSVAAATLPKAPRVVPTVAEFVDQIDGTFTEGTASTYRSYWKLAVARFGTKGIDELDFSRCQEIVGDAERRACRSRAGSDGRSARENCVGALRALLDRAERAGYIAGNPALDIDKPRRLPNRRRALDQHELSEAIDAVRTTSRDPDLDLLLVQFHLESAARREGALNLVVDDLIERRSTIWLREKFGIEREQPVRPSLLLALRMHAETRGATKGDEPVFRLRNGRPITRRRYNTLFDKAQAVLPWSTRTPFTAHVLKHTGVTAVERIAGYAVAQAFAGHRPTSVTGTYAKARIDEIARAIVALSWVVAAVASG